MYERDMSNEEIIVQELKRLNNTVLQISSTKDLLQEISDILQMILENQNQAYLIMKRKLSTEQEDA